MPLLYKGAAFLFGNYCRDVTHSKDLFEQTTTTFSQNTNKTCNNTIIRSPLR